MPKPRICPKFLVGVPTLAKPRFSANWAMGFRHLGMPLGSSIAEKFVFDKDVADARNALIEVGLDLGVDYIFMLGDDVVPPGNTLSVLWSRQVDVVTGVYWTKGHPSMPYIWRDYQQGPYLAWKAGEFFKINIAGCDCLMIKTDVLRELGPPWFSRDWLFSGDQDEPISMATEDYYFYARLKEAGYDAWCDTSVQCWHEERDTGIGWGLTPDMPQARSEEPHESGYESKLIADYGSGPKTRGDVGLGRVVRYDLREEVKPDVRCDIRKVPEADETFDVVHSNNVLEHYDYEEVRDVLKEWIRTLKVGGELRVEVPDFEDAIRHVLDGNSTEQDWWAIYGKPDHYDGYAHRFGFTKRGLTRLLESFSCLEDITVEHDPTGVTINLIGKARKAVHDVYKDLQPIFDNTEYVKALKRKIEEDGDGDRGRTPVIRTPVMDRVSWSEGGD